MPLNRESINGLKKAIIGQQWNDIRADESTLLMTKYGAHSALAELIRGARKEALDYQHASAALGAWAKDDLGDDEERAMVFALSHALRADPDCDHLHDTQLQRACEALQTAWGLEDFTELPARTGELQGRSFTVSPLAFWAAHDLVAHLWEPDAPPSSGPRTVATPILANITSRGLFRLTIELLECRCGGPFCPDLRYLGLTNICTSNGKEGNFLEAMNQVWEVSGLARKNYRGRWRIESPQSEMDQLVDDEETFHFPTFFAGRSAQAAALCSLLAATGDPYSKGNQDNICERDSALEPESLDERVAVTATVIPNSMIGRPQDLLLGPVGRICEKIKNAHPAIRTLVLSAKREQNAETAGQGPNGQRDAADGDHGPHGDVHVERARTVSDALDLLLLTNRHLRSYQNAVRDNWLAQWESGTACRDGDGPNRQNLADEFDTDAAG